MRSFFRQAKMSFLPTLIVLVFTISVLSIVNPAEAQIPNPTVLYSFQQAPTDAIAPWGAIAQGRDGNFYGTGVARAANFNGGVWRITPAGVETLLVSFPSNYISCEGLTLGPDGNFYGDCYQGGAHNSGLVYRVTPAGVLTDLHDFDGSAGDANPCKAPPILGPDGNLYGETNCSNFAGSIYKITTAGVYTNIYTLSGGNTLPQPMAFANDGNLYFPVATAAGFGNVGGVMRVTTKGVATLIAGFVAATGEYPYTGLTLGTDSQLYGATAGGGINGLGVIYKITTAGLMTDLYFMTSADNSIDNYNDLLQATTGNFYGTGEGGGIANQGGIYELTLANAFSSLFFNDPTNLGGYPSAPLMQHTNGFLYGTNSSNGPGGGGDFFSLNIGASPFISLVTPIPGGKETSKIGILGQGFDQTSVVKFGGTTATTVQRSGSTFLLATVPAGALTGKVAVTTGSTTLSTITNFKVKPTMLTFAPPSGPVGTLVTITGTGLLQTTKVTFNNVVATFTVTPDTRVTTTVPTGATTGKIVITTKGGTVASATNFTVN